MDGTILPELPKLRLHGDLTHDKVDANAVFVDWLTQLDERLQRSKFDALESLFIENCWWRDLLAFNWDLTSKNGTEKIGQYLRDSPGSISQVKTAVGGLKPHLVVIGEDVWVQGAFTFKTNSGTGTGFARLIHLEDGTWKAWTVFTQLERLDFQDGVEATRNQSHATTLRSATNGVNGKKNEDPQVLIVGAGELGLFPDDSYRHR